VVTPLENASHHVKQGETAEINTESLKEKLLLRRLKYVLKKSNSILNRTVTATT
jgi:hypothetical protein